MLWNDYNPNMEGFLPAFAENFKVSVTYFFTPKSYPRV